MAAKVYAGMTKHGRSLEHYARKYGIHPDMIAGLLMVHVTHKRLGMPHSETATKEQIEETVKAMIDGAEILSPDGVVVWPARVTSAG